MRTSAAIVSLLFLCHSCIFADTLTINTPIDYQIVQRSSKDKGKIIVAGKLETTKAEIGAIEARLTGNGIKGDWQKLLSTPKGESFRGALEAPTGAWYSVEVRALDQNAPFISSSVAHVGVGEVFVIAGQSNSANHAEEKLKPKSDKVVAFDGKSWKAANDPQPGASGGGGSFIPPFADAIAEKFSVPVGIVATGVGASSIREWLPEKTTFPNPPTLLGNVTKLESGEWESKGIIFQRLVTKLQPLGNQGFRAVLWHQGESDANQSDPTRTLKGELYQKYLEQLIRESRREVGWDYPWFVAQVSYHSPADTGSEDIRLAQKALWNNNTALEGPDSDKLGSEYRDGNGKGVHFNGKGQREHAVRWVQKVAPWLEKQLATPPQTSTIGPSRGTLLIVGGGGKDPGIMRKFLELSGGDKAVIAVVPTAMEGDNFDNETRPAPALRKAGAAKVFVLHTRDKKVADSDEFADSLKQATGVWLDGGRQWRYADSYLNTKTQKALFDLLDRGGVIGGSSAGASIQSSYMVRGAREGNTIMMAPGYETGLGFIRDCAIDQHLIKRKRENDLIAVVQKHRHLLGIGIDEDTAVIVRGNNLEVIGSSKVAIYDPRRDLMEGEKFYYFLNSGEKFNLKTREKLP
ncbi:MAG: sialate O-acetylesterase [Gemmataceae bacterium]